MTAPFARELELLGVEPAEVDGAAARVVAALSSALADPNGRWVLGPQAEARSEVRLTLRAGMALEHIRLDRTFVAEGRRWIVDFKTSQHEGSDLRAFLDSEVARYAPQLERYALAVTATDVAARAARIVLSVARRAALLAGSRYSEPVRLSRRRPSASGSAVMILSPSTSDSGAPARGSTRASSA